MNVTSGHFIREKKSLKQLLELPFLRLLILVLTIYPAIRMDNDIVLFLAGVGVLVFYLIFSALTEMGTKLPWKK
ncbi:hypothetical protein [Coleofasciculus sp. FACHB-SPT36]|uniref:hypothetical protein n=1 Tax=Cyanophyceae TaxID=3028117 RepID=UPI00168B121B|nr:hypothetical protein [Coleofasciculus sp. FACHB-SPT36]MBD2539987.1 hypothetical protein [Coleofasciculus sp. FACHB-SPT36]